MGGTWASGMGFAKPSSRTFHGCCFRVQPAGAQGTHHAQCGLVPWAQALVLPLSLLRGTWSKDPQGPNQLLCWGLPHSPIPSADTQGSPPWDLGEQAQWELGAGLSRPDIPHLSPSRVGLWALYPISGCMYPLAEGGEGVQAVLILGGVAHLHVITAASLRKVKGGKGGGTVEDIRDSVHRSTNDR